LPIHGAGMKNGGLFSERRRFFAAFNEAASPYA
jgi:hypothetical protein